MHTNERIQNKNKKFFDFIHRNICTVENVRAKSNRINGLIAADGRGQKVR